MDEICRGTKTRQEVIDKIVSTMRPLYQRAARRTAALIAAARQEFRPVDMSGWRVQPLADNSRPQCGACGGQMQLRLRPQQANEPNGAQVLLAAPPNGPPFPWPPPHPMYTRTPQCTPITTSQC